MNNKLTFISDFVKLQDEMERQYQEIVAEDLANKSQWYDIKSSPLSPVIPASKVKEDFKQLFKQVMDDKEEQARISRGMQLIDENLVRISNDKLCRQELEKAAQTIASDLVEMTQMIAENLKKGESFENALILSSEEETNLGEETSPETDLATLSFSIANQYGLSSVTLNTFYEIGMLLFKESKIEEARCVFQFLSVIDAFCYEVWLSLGICHQEIGDIFAAYTAYSVAASINPENPLLYLYMAECFLANQDQENTRGSLQLAEYFNQEKQDETVKERIFELKNLIK